MSILPYPSLSCLVSSIHHFLCLSSPPITSVSIVLFSSLPCLSSSITFRDYPPLPITSIAILLSLSLSVTILPYPYFRVYPPLYITCLSSSITFIDYLPLPIASMSILLYPLPLCLYFSITNLYLQPITSEPILPYPSLPCLSSPTHHFRAYPPLPITSMSILPYPSHSVTSLPFLLFIPLCVYLFLPPPHFLCLYSPPPHFLPSLYPPPPLRTVYLPLPYLIPPSRYSCYTLLLYHPLCGCPPSPFLSPPSPSCQFHLSDAAVS